jgi:tRNA threonylcarbamoyladenosine biosynthesis protein TsaE
MTGVYRSMEVGSTAEMVSVGRQLARLLRPGDLVVLSGDLGSGKTTLTRGIGVGLGVRGAVTSPTFVIARVHPSLSGGPDLVHVDAYRLAGFDEVEDLDLEASLDESVTVVEWGEGKVEGLADDRLEVRIGRSRADDGERDGSDARLMTLVGVGPRWDGVDLDALQPTTDRTRPASG